jgi:hypothetical protein
MRFLFITFPWCYAAAITNSPWGTPWLYANAGGDRLTASGSIATWAPVHPDTVVTYVKPMRVSSTGDSAVLNWGWKSNGTDACPSDDFPDGCLAGAKTCAYKSVSCVGGTGDFRVGMYDSNGQSKMTDAGYCPTQDYDPMEVSRPCNPCCFANHRFLNPESYICMAIAYCCVYHHAGMPGCGSVE